MKSKEKQRIVLLDLLRAIAVVMMIQGHTIHSILDESYSHSNNLLYQTWVFFRGVTAPFFIFASGLIFTYLLLQNPIVFKDNTRISKGIIRGISLILFGYLLRYPTINIFKLSETSNAQWLTFFSVDALHLIGIGLLLIIVVSYFAEYLKINLSFSFAVIGFIILFTSPFINSLGWENTPIPIASYFTSKFGSIFPLFPYLLYMFFGASLGYFITNEKSILKKYSFLLIIFGIGLTFVLIALILNNGFGLNLYFNSLTKLGALFLLVSILGSAFRNISKLPNYLQSLAKNSLSIYIVHLVIIYGSPASIGLYQVIGKTQSAEAAILGASIMIILMTIISLGIDKFRVRKNSFEYR